MLGGQFEAELADYLCTRLSKNSTDCKLKALRAMHFIARRGSMNFRLGMQQRTQPIRAHLQYRGPPHPVHGDAPSKMIRETAKACMDSIFSSEPPQMPPQQGRAQQQGQQQQFGGPPPARQAMEGFGGGGEERQVEEFRNGPAPSQRGRPADPSGTFTNEVAPGQQSSIGNYDIRHEQQSGFGGAMHKAKMAAAQGATLAGSTKAGMAAKQMAANYGVEFKTSAQMNPQMAGGMPGGMPGAAAPQPIYQPPSLDGSGGGAAPAPAGGDDGWGTPTSQVMANIEEQKNAGGPRVTSVESGEYEAKLVDDMCEPAGARSKPGKDQLAKFAQACSTLDANIICSFLEEKLEDEVWQTQLRACCAIEVLVKGNTGAVEYFGDEGAADGIGGLVDAPQSALRTQATKTMTAIKKAAKAMEAPPPAAAPDFGALAADAGGFGAPAGGDMFGGMSVFAAPAMTGDAAADAANMFGDVGMSAPEPAAAPDADSMFGGMQAGGGGGGFGFAAATPAVEEGGGFGFAAPAAEEPAAEQVVLTGVGTPAGLDEAPAATEEAPATEPSAADLTAPADA